MKKLLYLLPFLILNFGFCSMPYVLFPISGNYFDTTSRIMVGFDGSFITEIPSCRASGPYRCYNIYKPDSVIQIREHSPYLSGGYIFDDSQIFDNFYSNLTGIGRLFYYIERTPIKCPYPNSLTPCFTFSYDYWEREDIYVSCNSSNGEFFNSDTLQCDTNCDLIPNLKIRSECQCKKAGLGGFVSSGETLIITNCVSGNCSPDNSGFKCKLVCENGELNLDHDFCYIDDKFIGPNDDECQEGGTTCDNNNNNDNNSTNNNNNDDNSTGGGSSSGNLGGGGGPEYDYCKLHPDICNPNKPDTNTSNPPSGGGGGSTGGNTGGGGGSTGGGNNGGNNNNNDDPNGQETTPSGGDNPPSDDTGDDDGECKGENCTPNDITSDYKKMLDDAQGKFDGAYSDTKNQIDGLIDTAKSAINDIKNGGFIQHGKIRITTCPVKSEVIDFRFFTYRFEYDLCEWLTRLYNVFYFLTLVTCLFFGLKWILSHIFNIGGSE